MDEYADDGQDLGLPPKPSPLPWVLFGVSVLVGAVIAVMLMIKVDTERSQKLANEQLVAEQKERASRAEAKQKDLTEQVDRLNSDLAQMKADRDALQQKIAAAPAAASKKTAGASGKTGKKRKKH
jgi:septal ring factor EnvC (AmiA/AmiB activator)